MHFLLQGKKKPMRGSVVLDLIFTNKERLVENMKFRCSLGCSDRELVEFKILRAGWRAHSKLIIVDSRRANFVFLRDMLARAQ